MQPKLRTSVTKQRLRHSGEEVLDADEMEQTFDSVIDDMVEKADMHNALTLEQTQLRATEQDAAIKLHAMESATGVNASSSESEA